MEESYRPRIELAPEWEWVELGEVSEVNPKKSQMKDLSGEMEVSFVPMADLNENEMDFEAKEVKKLADIINGYTYFADNDVLLAKFLCPMKIHHSYIAQVAEAKGPPLESFGPDQSRI